MPPRATSLCVWLLFAAGQALAGPDLLYCDDPIKDFGRIGEGDQVSHVFIVQNRSDQVVRPVRIISSCGCLVPRLDVKEIAGHAKLMIPVEFHTFGYGGMTVEKHIRLFAGTQQAAPLTLTIKAQIDGIPPENRVHVMPREKHILNDRSAVHTITVQTPAAKHVYVTAQGPEWLTIQLGKPRLDVSAGLNDWTVQFTLNRTVTEPVMGSIVLTTNVRHFEKVVIPIYVEQRPRILVDPPLVLLNVPAPNESATKTLRIKRMPAQERQIGDDPCRPAAAMPVLEEVHRTTLQDPNRAVPVPALRFEGSADCISVLPLPSEPAAAGEELYMLTLRDCAPGIYRLRLMYGKDCLRTIPIILKPPPDRKND